VGFSSGQPASIQFAMDRDLIGGELRPARRHLTDRTVGPEDVQVCPGYVPPPPPGYAGPPPPAAVEMIY